MTINCKGKLIDFDSPKVMGILNITPDSFYDGGKYKSEKQILTKVDTLLSNGATFIDIGAYSSRPGADDISIEEEKSRLLPIVELMTENFKEDLLISVDTFRSEVADISIQMGVCMINDISAGLLDPMMMDTIAKHQVPYIMMHMKGNPQTMKSLAQYDNLISEVKTYFSERVKLARQKGINDIILDPGFGFAKNIEHNFEMLNKFELFRDFDLPLLCGISRKSMIYKTLHTTPDKALNGTTALHALAIYKGANILRVHDAKEAHECIELLKKIQEV